MLELESILDTPKEGLDPAVWKADDSGKFVLTDEAQTKIQTIVDYEIKKFGLKNVSVRITGSITSNQYSEDSDIDVHMSFDGLNEGNSDDLNKVARRDFEEHFKVDNPNSYNIGHHPIEIYFQVNPFQDLMSIGCYDFIQKMWMVGPDLKPLDFDPYSEFYSDGMEYVKDVISDIRNVILECYETAMVIQNSSDGDFKNAEFDNLKKKLIQGVDIFNAAKQCRKVYSSPVSVKDALEKRESRKWKIADSSFKLMDKFGYLKILKNFAKITEKMDMCDADSVSDSVIRSVQTSMNITETIDESIKNLGKYLIFASFLYIPGILPMEALAQSFSKIDKTELNMYAPAVQTAIQSVCKDQTKYGKYTAADIVNMITRTIYVEGHSEGTKGRKAILSVILNRSGGNVSDIPAVIREKSAFSCWRKMKSSDWDNFIYKIPTTGPLSVVGNKKNKEIWSECVDLALQLFNGQFKSTIGNRNSYLNPKKARVDAVNTWGTKMDLRIENHKFGYLREHDPKFVIPGTMEPRKTKSEQKN